MEEKFEDLIASARENENTALFFFLLFCFIGVGVGIDKFLLSDVTTLGLTSILIPFCYLGIVGLLIAKERKEDKELDYLLSIQEKEDWESKTAEAEQKATAQEQLATDLQAQLDAERSKVKGLVDAQTQLTTANGKIATLNEKLATVESELATAKDNLTTAKQAEATAVATVKKQLATVQSTVEELREDKKRLLGEISYLTPYHGFYTSYEKYKDAESIKNSRNSSEGDKAKATAVFNKAKGELASFYQEQKEKAV